jgi:acylphosphatase
MNVCRRCRVEGLVQGVFFRGATRARAQQLGVTGWAKNLPDGSVEVLVCGAEVAVAQLCEWLWQGPPQSRVSDVRCNAEAWQEFSAFTSR